MCPSRRYEIIDHTADSGIRVYGASPAELFVNAAFGLLATIVEGLDDMAPTDRRPLTLEAPDMDALLVDWMNDRLLRFDADEEIHAWPIVRDVTPTRLVVESGFRPIEWDRDVFHAEVKSATYHGLSIREKEGTWVAEVILDL